MQMKFNLSGTILRIVGKERRLSMRLPREKLKNARVPSPSTEHRQPGLQNNKRAKSRQWKNGKIRMINYLNVLDIRRTDDVSR